MDKIDNYILKISGGIYIPEELDKEKVVSITNAEVTLYSEEKRDNQDGTYNLVYKGKVTSAVEFVQEQKKIIGKPKQSQSVGLRRSIEFLADSKGMPDREEFYKIYTDKIMSNAEEVWDRIKDL